MASRTFANFTRTQMQPVLVPLTHAFAARVHHVHHKGDVGWYFELGGAVRLQRHVTHYVAHALSGSDPKRAVVEITDIVVGDRYIFYDAQKTSFTIVGGRAGRIGDGCQSAGR